MAKYRRLGELLIAAGTITEEQLERARELQKGTKERLGSVLITNGIITEGQLIDALTMQLGIDAIDLTKVNIPTELANAVPKNIAKQYQVVPVKVVGDEIYLAMSDPLNFYALEEVRKAVHKRVIPVVATESAVDRAIRVLYGNEGVAKAIEEMKRDSSTMSAGSGSQTDMTFVSNQLGEDVLDSAPAIRLVNSLIERAITERASDIHLEPQENDLRVRMRIDGMMREILRIPGEFKATVISRWKVMSGMDITERRVPQDGRFSVTMKDKELDLRVATLPTIYGEKIVARLLDKTGGCVKKNELGLSGDDEAKFNKLLKHRNGVILIVGPTGSGKSTTMYAMINELNTPEVNLVTLEDPVEYNVVGINQVQINEKTGMTFANGLRSILRQDPDIIAVGEIRDGETAEIAMRAAITGHMVLSTIHTNDALGTIERLEDIGVESYLIGSAVKGVVSQRLLRKICPDCKKAYTPDAEELRDLGLEGEEGLKLYKGAGCPNCFNTGYRGRTAVFEMLEINGKVRDLVSKKASREVIEESLTGEGSSFVSLRDNAIRLVKAGKTTSEEVLRVVNMEE